MNGAKIQDRLLWKQIYLHIVGHINVNLDAGEIMEPYSHSINKYCSSKLMHRVKAVLKTPFPIKFLKISKNPPSQLKSAAKIRSEVPSHLRIKDPL